MLAATAQIVESAVRTPLRAVGGGRLCDAIREQNQKLFGLDLKLPKVDGMEVLRQLKADPHTKTIPVVILTSSKEERDLFNGYHLGANSYIQKPVDFAQFRDTVKTAGLYWLVINQPPVLNGVAPSTAQGPSVK